jgi:uncharacterized delta-60 repeat protein
MKNLIVIWMCLFCVIPLQARTITVNAGPPDFASIQTANAEPNVTQEWVARYDGPASYIDSSFAIAIDSSDNIYVTGESYDNSTGFDYTTLKYSPDSNQAVWVARYDGPVDDVHIDSGDSARAIAVDSNDNIYVTGQSHFVQYPDYATVKYSPDSNQPVWVARYNGPDNRQDIAKAIAVDSNDNIYVTGESYGDSTYYDYATVKYSPDSNEAVWVARYNVPGNSYDVAEAVAIDSNDNIYVTGYSGGFGTHYDYLTIKYSPDSNEPLWVARYNGPGNSYDVAEAIVIDSNDNIYVTGPSAGSAMPLDYATIKYSPDSNQPVWIARYNGPDNYVDAALAIAVDSNDNIYVTGQSTGVGTGYDYATVKYSPDSNEAVWVARYNGSGNGDDIAKAIAIDSGDNIYVTGESWGSGTENDYVTIKYSPDSNQPVWVARYNGPVEIDMWDRASAIAIDSSDNIYVTGNSEGSATYDTFKDYATVKYSQTYPLPLEPTLISNPRPLTCEAKANGLPAGSPCRQITMLRTLM